MYKLKYLDNALEDYDNILFYISRNLKNTTAALKLKKEINMGEKIILTFPHGMLKYKKKYKYYVHKVKNYNIFYTIDEKNKIITIVRILYKKRNIDNLLK